MSLFDEVAWSGGSTFLGLESAPTVAEVVLVVVVMVAVVVVVVVLLLLAEYKTFLSLVQEGAEDDARGVGVGGDENCRTLNRLILLISCLRRVRRSFCSDCCISNISYQ